MNKSLYLAYWLLVLMILASLVGIGYSSWSLWQINKLNDVIAGELTLEEESDNVIVQFSQAYHEAEAGKKEQALSHLTNVIASDNGQLNAMAYYNRANLHLHEGKGLRATDGRRLSLVALAKQDYRTALAIDPKFWQARYNLEIALLIVPELPSTGPKEEKKITSRRSIKSVGFRVDLP